MENKLTEPDNQGLLELTADIVSAFVSNNAAHAGDLPDLIKVVHAALIGITAPKQEAPPAAVLTPAVPVKKSVTDDYLICLEDGKRFKSLKRHLQSAYGMTPAAYREKWGLPRDYPMVAPGYAAKRSQLAKDSGLGVGRRKPVAEPAPAPAEVAPMPKAANSDSAMASGSDAKSPAKRRGRPAKKAA
jgi:predicted transcriptional regulator